MICRPSDHTVGRPWAEIRTRDRRSRSRDPYVKHKIFTFLCLNLVNWKSTYNCCTFFILIQWFQELGGLQIQLSVSRRQRTICCRYLCLQNSSTALIFWSSQLQLLWIRYAIRQLIFHSKCCVFFFFKEDISKYRCPPHTYEARGRSFSVMHKDG